MAQFKEHAGRAAHCSRVRQGYFCDMKPYEHAGQAHPPPLVLGPGRQGPEAEHGGVLAPPDLREQLLPRGFLHQLHLRRQPPAWQAAHTSRAWFLVGSLRMLVRLEPVEPPGQAQPCRAQLAAHPHRRLLHQKGAGWRRSLGPATALLDRHSEWPAGHLI